MTLYTVTIEVDVFDSQALYQMAVKQRAKEGYDPEYFDLGTEGEPDVEKCLVMLLDRSSLIEDGAEIAACRAEAVVWPDDVFGGEQ